LTVRCGDVLFEVLAAFGARDGNDVVALGKEPRQRELAARHVLLGGDLVHALHQLEVLIEVLALEAR
jgi:hypothetical protein